MLVGSYKGVYQSFKPSNGLCHEAYIQVCRGLMITSVCLGFFGAILALIGMKCTRIGGSETTKARLTVLSGFHFILSGKTHAASFSVSTFMNCSLGICNQ